MWDEGHHTCPQVGTPSRDVCTSWLRRCPGSRCAKETPYFKNKQALHFWIMTWQLFWCPHVFRSLQRLAWVRFFFFFALKDFLIVASPWYLPTCFLWMGVILGLLNPSCVHRNHVPQLLLLIFPLSKETGQSAWLMGQLSMKKPAGVLGGSSAVEWADPGMSPWFRVSSPGKCPQERRKPVPHEPQALMGKSRVNPGTGSEIQLHCMQTSVREWCQNYQLRARCL